MNRFKTQLSSLIRFLMSGAIALSVGPVMVVQESTAQQIQPVVVRVKSLGKGRKMPIGWRVSEKQRDFNQYVVPNDPSLKGARIFQAESKEADLAVVLKRALAFDGFEDIQVGGDIPIQNVRFFDPSGKGRAFAGRALLNGKRYGFAAVGLYMTFDRNPRFTTHSIFAAPEDVFVRMGGFIPVSSTYFDLNGNTIKDLILRAGRTEPSIQAKYLANATDIYLAKAARVINASKNRVVLPNFMLLDGQCTGVSGTDPDAYGVTGLENPDC